jgi:two-component system, NtrC family, sensor histidine kinase HydH
MNSRMSSGRAITDASLLPTCQNVDAMTGRSLAWIRNPPWQAAFIGISIIVLAILPWIVPVHDVLAHNVLHHLNFLPLMVAGMLFGWRGALVSTSFAALIHLPHASITWLNSPLDASDQLVEISIFGMAGIIVGFLSDRERRQRTSLERTKGELEEVYRELQQNIERLKKAERLYAAGQLAASLAHEIRNPLASISGAAGILKRGHASGENTRDCLEIIEKESQRLNKLLTSFLDFARPKAPRFQMTDLRPVLESVAALATHAANSQQIEFLRNVHDGLPEVECDPEQLKQVLLNLLINAIQASNGAGTIWLDAAVRTDRISILVRDQGCGIPPAEQDRIFDPFFTTKENGTGLGLAIASMIVEQHGGLLTAEHNQDKGMTFRLELPLDRRQPI